MSMMTSVSTSEKMHTPPDASSDTLTELATVWLPKKFTFDVCGIVVSHANTVMKPDPTALVAVTFSTTELASAGIPVSPAIRRCLTV